ncbi:MAG: DNA translocase FtsK [Eubacteriales bacterium]|nr:DNA translocase FtsK [Eubacteriales bacterium]
MASRKQNKTAAAAPAKGRSAAKGGAKSTAKRRGKTPASEIVGLILAVLGIYLFICVVMKSAGIVGDAVKQGMYGLFGLTAYVAPLGLVVLGGCFIMKGTKRKKSAGLWAYVAIVWSLFCLFGLFFANRYDNATFRSFVADAYALGQRSLVGAGAASALLLFPATKYLGNVGAFLVFTTIILTISIVKFRLSLRKTGEEIKQVGGRVAQATGQRVEEYRQRSVEQREMRVAQREHRAKSPLFVESMARSSVHSAPDVDIIQPDMFEDALRKPGDSVPEPDPFYASRKDAAGGWQDEELSVLSDQNGTLFAQEAHSDPMADTIRLPHTAAQEPPQEEHEPPRRSDGRRDGDPIPWELGGKTREEETDLPAAQSEDTPQDEAEGPARIWGTPRAASDDGLEPNFGRLAGKDSPVTAAAPPSAAQQAEPAPKPEKTPEPETPEDAEKPKVYQLPPITLLDENPDRNRRTSQDEYMEGAHRLEETLLSFGVKCHVINVSAGPAITRYELQPAPGVKISRIVNLSNDIALSMAASGVRIEAPIPGKAAIGVEVPNARVAMVHLRDVLDSPEFAKAQSPLAFALGKDIAGKCIVSDVAKMPHVLIAGATGSGKSVCINALILSLLYRSTPEQVRMIMIDPKVVELSSYNGIPHLLIPVVTDAKKAAGALNYAVQEMTRRYGLFAETGARDIHRYHEIVADDPQGEHLPQIVVIIDELADLMMVAPNDVEDSICRIAQLARAAGIHLVIATQRPSVDVITGIIKANIPSRVAFAVSSQVDSRTILDMAGAEKLLGRGDMLFNPSGAIKPLRVQGAYVSDAEVERVVEFIKGQADGQYDADVLKTIDKFEITQKGGTVRGRVEDEGADFGNKLDPLLSDAVDVVCDLGQASISMLQRKLRLGYARAARMIDELEELGVIGPSSGSKPREVIVTRNEAKELVEASKEGLL